MWKLFPSSTKIKEYINKDVQLIPALNINFHFNQKFFSNSFSKLDKHNKLR